MGCTDRTNALEHWGELTALIVPAMVSCRIGGSYGAVGAVGEAFESVWGSVHAAGPKVRAAITGANQNRAIHRLPEGEAPFVKPAGGG